MDAVKRRTLALALAVTCGLTAGGCQRRESQDAVDPKIGRAAEVIAGNADGARHAAEAVASTAGAAAAAAGDAALTAKVKSALLSQLDLSALRIEVDTKDAIVTLSGRVESAPERERAKQAALRVAGVRYLLDNIEVTLERGG